METHRVHEVVRDLRAKPRHIRERMALGVAGGVTLVVALGWVAASAATGVFSLSPSTLANAPSTNVGEAVAQGKSNFSDLLGAAGAAFSGSSTTAQIQVVDSSNPPAATDQNNNNTSATVLHF